tara:strand:- start:533 stop:763 length:231 start_codon:yes stop_codon:yes gene_type:complete
MFVYYIMDFILNGSLADGQPQRRPLNPIDGDKPDPRRAVWLHQLKQENPDVPDYFLDIMIETYLLNPNQTEKIIMG